MSRHPKASKTRTEALVEKLVQLGPIEAHRLCQKVITLPGCPIDFKLFATWYTPGVAKVCREIEANPESVWSLTGRGNSVAVVSDGTRILGLGREGVWGAESAMPVMEGKALLFRALGAVGAVPLVMGFRRPDGSKMTPPTAQQIVNTVLLLQANYGGINLEDITVKDDKCHRVLQGLREHPDMFIPVWHDDQQGTATVILAGAINALKLAGKKKENIEIACIGSGAAMVATIKLLIAWGIEGEQIRLVDSKGTVDGARSDISDTSEKGKLKRVVRQLNIMGGDASKQEAIRGADVLIAASASVEGGILQPEWIQTMKEKAIVFAVANPHPEIAYNTAKQAGAFIIGTGRSDFPNQINNSLGFPGIFRGVLDVRASTITDQMALEAADAIAVSGQRLSNFGPGCIVPLMDDLDMVTRVAVYTARRAIEEGLADQPFGDEHKFARGVRGKLDQVRQMNEALMQFLEI